MYHIVEFDDENVEIIHSNWIEKIDDDNRQMADVAFPPKNLYGSIRKYLRHKVFPSSTWTSYRIKILSSMGTFIKIAVFRCYTNISKNVVLSPT